MKCIVNTNVGMLIIVVIFNHTHVFEWYVIRCGSKNMHGKHMCLEEIGLHDENKVSIPWGAHFLYFPKEGGI